MDQNKIKLLKVVISIALSYLYFSYPSVLTKCLPVLWDALCCNRDEYGRAIALGLMLGACGDATIGYNFVIGLVFFLLNHLVDIHAFFLSDPQRFVPVIIFGAVYFFLLMPILLPYVPENLLFWVILYALVLVYSACVATMRLVSGVDLSNRSKVYACVGSWVFVISDSLLAIEMFIAPGYAGSNAVMVTYYVAQLLISLSSYADTPQVKDGMHCEFQFPSSRQEAHTMSENCHVFVNGKRISVVRPLAIHSCPEETVAAVN